MIVTVYQNQWMTFVEHDAIRTDPTRMAQGIMTGIGFLGAGVIFKEGLTVRGLTTALRYRAQHGLYVQGQARRREAGRARTRRALRARRLSPARWKSDARERPAHRYPNRQSKREFTWAEGARKSSIRFSIKIAPVPRESAAATTRRFKQEAARLARAFVKKHEAQNTPKGEKRPTDAIDMLIMPPT
jgi:hypothetical protein